MTGIKCFMLEPTGQCKVYLRRYQRSDIVGKTDCPNGGYHNARTFAFEEPQEYDEQGYISNGTKPLLDRSDSRWPRSCSCGYVFKEEDEWQRFTETLFRRSDTSEEITIAEAPPGAMWYAPWFDNMFTPQGPHNLVVKTPGGEWNIDGQANNCTMKDDFKQERHHCWVRTGTPPDVTAGKDGPTCSAGAGSIQCNNYHGFLRNGYLED